MEPCSQCNGMKHVLVDGAWRRCACLEKDMNRLALGMMYTEKPMAQTELLGVRDQNLILSGPLEGIRQHVARVLLEMGKQRLTWVAMDAYRLIEIFLEQDKEFETTSVVVDCELLLLLLGFGDPRNRYLPELIIQTLNRRALIRKPTWVLLGLPIDQLSAKYSAEVRQALEGWKRVVVS